MVRGAPADAEGTGVRFTSTFTSGGRGTAGRGSAAGSLGRSACPVAGAGGDADSRADGAVGVVGSSEGTRVRAAMRGAGVRSGSSRSGDADSLCVASVCRCAVVLRPAVVLRSVVVRSVGDVCGACALRAAGTLRSAVVPGSADELRPAVVDLCSGVDVAAAERDSRALSVGGADPFVAGCAGRAVSAVGCAPFAFGDWALPGAVFSAG